MNDSPTEYDDVVLENGEVVRVLRWKARNGKIIPFTDNYWRGDDDNYWRGDDDE